jgi:MoaA/NifB/PqqE/SkfB family radical SAM enzyme
MTLELTILYRGPLASCNYGCDYCPFAKREDPPEALEQDRLALSRFSSFLERRPASDQFSIFFTPWGEALIRAWYRDALVKLTHLPQIARAAVQTNLSVPIDFAEDCVPEKLGIWATYHPEWTERRRFVARVRELHERGVSVSAGVVGFRRFAEEIAALRAELPNDVYLWINAPKSFETSTDLERAAFTAIDPYFPLNTREHPSLGRRCFAGETAIAVDGDGTMRRCHFLPEVIGNLYAEDFERALQPRACTRPTCGCHIGYVYLEELALDRVFTLERALAGSDTRGRSIRPA